jgi:serine protease
MKRKLCLAALTLLVAAPVLAKEGDRVKKVDKPAEDGLYIVTFDPAMVDSQLDRSVAIGSLAYQLAGSHRGHVRHVLRHALTGAVIQLASEEHAELLAQHPAVLLVEENGLKYASATQSPATWGLDRIDQRDLPLSNSYTYDTTASNVNAYIIDTGIRTTHSQFGGRAVHGRDTVDNDNNATDCNGHGTHVAGTVGGSTYGVAKAAHLIAVRVLNCQGSGTDAGVIAGIDWVTQNHVKPAVANMSLGGGASTSLDNAVRNSIAAGVTYAIAAGNDNANACNSSPARVGEAITVGSTTSSDARSSFSNFGTCLDIFAPGSSITSAWSTSDTATNTISGTSMATPHVAGVAALYLAANPNATPAQVRNAIVAAATTGKVTSAGSGSPNVLLYSLFGGAPPPPPPPPTDTQLTNGVAVAAADAAGGQKFYYIDVPAGQASLVVQLSGGSGDADMYVQLGSKPTLSTYQCRPYLNGNNESCTFNAPAAGRWWIMLHAYTAYSGASLRATYTAGGGGCGGSSFSGSLSSGGSAYHPSPYYQSTVSGTHTGALDGPSGTDFDLYLQKWNGFSWASVASGTTPSDNESVTYSGTAGYYRWRVHAFSGSGSYTLCTTRP